MSIPVIDDRVQFFPQYFKLDLSLQKLLTQVGRSCSKTYSYVLTTVIFDESRNAFQQTGSGPNFQGGRLTLCTCKHQMRSGMHLPVENWKNVWIVGFTSRQECDYNWLFYLTQVHYAKLTQNALWRALPSEVRADKSSRRSRLGDLYQPKANLDCPKCLDPNCQTCFDPESYYRPMIGHSHHQTASDDTWIDDIDSVYYNRRPALLVGKPQMTFLWEHPLIRFRKNHPRTKTWNSLSAMLQQLTSISQ